MDPVTQTRIVAAWQALPDECRFPPATEDELAGFEAAFEPIPADLRWFLGTCGGGTVGAEWIDSISELPASHAKFRTELGPGGWSIDDVFIIGWDGWGNPFGIRRRTGEIVLEDHNGGGVRVLARSLERLLTERLVKQASGAA